MIAINRHLWILRFRNMLDEIGWVWPTFQNVAVALIHMNYPLMGEKRTISDSEGMSLCMFVCLGCLTIPLHLSFLCVIVCVWENNAHSCCSSSSPWEGFWFLSCRPSLLHFTLVVLKRGDDAPIHPHSRRFPVSVTLRSASFSVFY